MNKTLVLTLLAAITVPGAYADTKVLTPEKGGTYNKIFDDKQSHELKVAAYNIAAGRVSNLESVANAIKSLDADLIALNEVDVKTERSGVVDQVAELARLTGMHGAFGRAIDFEGGQYGVAVLSKFPIEKQEVFPLPSGDAESRVLLITQVRKPGLDEPILFMTTHLDWLEDPSLRIQQVREIQNVTIGNTDSAFPEIASRIKILAGDFNDVSNSQVITELRRYWNPVEQNGLDNRTWPAANPALDLDHLFTFKGQRWAVQELQIPNQSAEWQGTNWPAVSDHVPVVATLRLLEQ